MSIPHTEHYQIYVSYRYEESKFIHRLVAELNIDTEYFKFETEFYNKQRNWKASWVDKCRGFPVITFVTPDSKESDDTKFEVSCGRRDVSGVLSVTMSTDKMKFPKNTPSDVAFMYVFDGIIGGHRFHAETRNGFILKLAEHFDKVKYTSPNDE